MLRRRRRTDSGKTTLCTRRTLSSGTSWQGHWSTGTAFGVQKPWRMHRRQFRYGRPRTETHTTTRSCLTAGETCAASMQHFASGTAGAMARHPWRADEPLHVVVADAAQGGLRTCPAPKSGCARSLLKGETSRSEAASDTRGQPEHRQDRTSPGVFREDRGALPGGTTSAHGAARPRAKLPILNDPSIRRVRGRS